MLNSLIAKSDKYTPQYIGILSTLANSTSKHSQNGQYFKGLLQELDMVSLVDELLSYYNKIQQTTNWEDKFKQTSLKDADLTELFYTKGFAKSSNECYLTNVEFEQGDVYLSEYYSTMDAWLYSFWLRRYNEGNMEFAKETLEWLQALK